MAGDVEPLEAPAAIRIGDWTFAPAANELCRGEAKRRLEHRAARTLELLAMNKGQVVSQDEILKYVWNGRSISPNSVSVVIRDLRQALGDDAREPRHIETVAKQGYRLVDPGTSAPDAAPVTLPAPRRSSRAAALALLLLLVAILAIVGAVRGTNERVVSLVVDDVANATGNAAFQPLASATSEVIVADAQKLKGVEIFRDERLAHPKKALILRSRLILWSGKPTMMMSVQDRHGALVWTGMTSGDEHLIPRDVAAAMQDLSGKLQPGK